MNNAKFYNKKKTEKMVNALISHVEENKHTLLDLSMLITGNSMEDTLEDYNYVLIYLKNYIREHYTPLTKKYLKPKGDVLLLLSYNEPIVMNTIVVLNAIVAGNNVFCKPSRKAESIFNKIWFENKNITKLNLNLQSINPNKFKIENTPHLNAIYFFGGRENAIEIAIHCAKDLIEFHPEIETADVAVVTDLPAEDAGIKKLANKLVNESYTHQGKMCQRLQGVYIKKTHYSKLLTAIKSERKKYLTPDSSIFCPKTYIAKIKREISTSGAKKFYGNVVQKYVPVLVDSPDLKSKLIKNAYFYPILWLAPYQNTEELISHLASRCFFHGININGSDKKAISEIISKTQYSRITVNTSHTLVRTNEGWGGVSPSGFGGNKDWLVKFSNQYAVILR